MGPHIFKPNPTSNLSKFRILKNLIVVSLSFMFLASGKEGLVMLQTSMNKGGLGAATIAAYYVACGITSLIFSSFTVKKLGSRNTQILSVFLILPFIACNVDPMWITMLPSSILSGVGLCLLWAAQSTYINECSVLFCEIENNLRNSNFTSFKTLSRNDSYVDKKATILTSHEQIEELSAVELSKMPFEKHGPLSIRRSTMVPENIPSVRLTAYKCKKDGSSEKQSYSKEKDIETAMEVKPNEIDVLRDSKTQNIASIGINEGIYPGIVDIKNKTSEEAMKNRDNLESTKALFFGFHGLVYNSAVIWSNLISYYVLPRNKTVNNSKNSDSFCGVGRCSTNEIALDDNIEDVPGDIRYLLIGIFMASGILAPLLIILFLDRMDSKIKHVDFSWENVLATIKYVKIKDQLFLIPFTIGASLCRGFYIADFTKSYIACAWSISHIGLITLINGVTAAIISISSGAVIKYVGRIPVMVLCQIIIIADFVFLYFWKPSAQEPYMLYLQGGAFGMMSGIFNSQSRALYGIFFEGDEATAFSSFNLYSSIGWALAFIYGDFLCVSIKIFIVLSFSVAGLIGYLFAEWSYSLRNKKKDSSDVH